jgi:hypothetical protein
MIQNNEPLVNWIKHHKPMSNIGICFVHTPTGTGTPV